MKGVIGISTWYRMAGLSDLPRLVSGDRVHHSCPPAGTHLLCGPEPGAQECAVLGEPTDGRPGDWWVTTLGELQARAQGWTDSNKLLKLAEKYLSRGPLSGFVQTVNEWPMIWTWSEGPAMRWIKVTLRGTLAPNEQFQHQLNFGVPGNDPTLDEAAAPEYAHSVATAWASTAGPILGRCTPAVSYTEVGAVQMEQDDPTDSSGKGGNRRQSYPTGWWTWPTGSRPVGLNSQKCLPYEVSCAITLQSGTRGPRGRGRCYLPPFSVDNMDSGAPGLFLPSLQTEVGAAFGAFVAAAEAATTHQVLVVSGRAKQLHRVDQVLVGKVPDSQRRRRKSLDEARATGWTRP